MINESQNAKRLESVRSQKYKKPCKISQIVISRFGLKTNAYFPLCDHFPPIFSSATEIYWEIMRLRGVMAQARLGISPVKEKQPKS